jgi:hypothetical protein
MRGALLSTATPPTPKFFIAMIADAAVAASQVVHEVGAAPRRHR